MILLLNGAFGIGKTSVARVLVKRMPGAVLYDPEIVGIVLQRAARMVGRDVPDFQELRLWRQLTIAALWLVRRFRRTVIVPMAFSEVRYLEEIRDGIARFETMQFHFCLVAPLDVVQQRLQTRRLKAADAAWQYRRAAECCAVHGDGAFAMQVNAADRDVNEIADEIVYALASAIRRSR
ncbi:MAG TPA: AAA family ATPase [Thermoanaerobaculia bacterium]